MKQTTRRKVKIVGYEQYINKTTGEVEDFQVIDIAEKDANFHKFWLFNVINSLDLIGNKKMKFAFWLIENMDSSNKISWTMRQMAEKSGVSLDTVRITMRALMDSNFLVKQNIANYQINPEAIFKGGKDKRLKILLDKFKNKEIEKHYICCSYGIPQKNSDSVNGYLFKDSKKSIVYISDSFKKGYSKIKTSYNLIKSNPSKKLCLLDVTLHTGKTHQIRAHLSHIGLPILGDGKYGSYEINKRFNVNTQLLCSYSLTFKFTTPSGMLDYLNGKIIKLPNIPFTKYFN